MWTKIERNGKVDQAKGKVKETVGTVTGNDQLKTEGQIDQALGKAETAVGRTSRKTGEVIARVGKAVKH